ncbi:phosphatidylinositol-glycan biosynthesis class S protein [Pseudomassariella vexata]|uniref:Phosphatidylinositol-glycan biosynthesis class S protein n=1 Tax=Pseudomassariella vexata TaxID=1141098 RepID=A0A1Y2E604_9PEZI|nr:phosphatidylinositol-glycan biosynthesis class S protein [Pseudomassariella vexata]ORY66990.1 phosphatidylinositol-glycan biosynthesis class S protein [Pseudomassariella vexata]
MSTAVENGGTADLTSRKTASLINETADSSLPAAAATGPKEPPPEKPADTRRRTWVIFSFWAIVLALGLPIWWKTTSIYRAELPLSEMLDWADGKACRPAFPLRIALDASPLQEHEAQNLLRLTQHALDDLNDFSGHHLRLQLAANADPTKTAKTGSDVALTIRITPGDSIHSASSSLHPHLPILDVAYPPNSIPTQTSSSSGLATYLAAQLRSTFAEEQNVISYLLETSSIPSEHRPKGISPEVAETLSKQMTRSMKYSRTYHLTFSLFTNGPEPSSWDIESAIDEYMRPMLDMLSPIHNFTIDTQVQLYATPGVQSQVLSKEDLSSFINAAEWPLSPSIGGAPTVNFVVYIGNQTIGAVSESEAADISRSWLIPQWGSVYLLLPPSGPHVSSETLKQTVLTFTSHLLSLLGTPQSGSLPMRLSTLNRMRSADLLLRASSSLGSLARLSLALPSISIPSSVADGVAKSMQHLQMACSTLGGSDSLEHARIAEAEAERAFFEKSMVGQLYFPDEHKVAVYLPLLGPVGVPLVMGLLNELKAWRKRRRQKDGPA